MFCRFWSLSRGLWGGGGGQLGKLLKTTYQSGFLWAPLKNVSIQQSTLRKHNRVLF